MISGPVVIVGDTLLDRDLDGVSERLARDGPTVVIDDPSELTRPGGAGLAALLSARQGHETVLITGLAPDPNGARLRDMLTGKGVRVVDLGLAGPTPEKIRIASSGRELLRVDRGARSPARVGSPGTDALEAMEAAGAILVSDYGGGVARSPRVRQALARRPAGSTLVWDPDPRGADPVAGTLLATPNVFEAAHHTGSTLAVDVAGLVAQARWLAARWHLSAVAITRGDAGALLVASSGSVTGVATVATSGDCCGAGDCFATSVTLALAAGAAVDDAVRTAVAAATTFVAGGGVATLSETAAHPVARPPRSPTPAATVSGVAARVRSDGGVVVATGGCFDVLHPGHLSVLSGARALGDCLIVCLNSDQSVRALKGPDRPLVPERDRAALLRALPWVDDVIIFSEPGPEAVLRRLRPDIWAKGGDYAVADLPEAETVVGWGGQVVTLPHVEGCSTTRLLDQAPPRTAGKGWAS